MRKFLQFTLSLLAMLMVTLNANAWKFASASPETGEVESLDRIVLNLPADAGWLTEFSATFTLTDQNGNETQCNFSTMSVGIVDTDQSFKGITTPGTYTLTIPAGSLHYMDANWMPTEPNEAQTFTWTIKDPNAGGGEQGGGEQGGGSATSGWSFTSVSPAEGEVESLKSFTFVLPSNLNWLNTGGTGTMTLPDGTIKDVSIYDNFTSINGDILVDDPLTAAGEYTLSIPANAIEGSDGTKNAAMTYNWTIKGAATGWSFTSVTPAAGEVESLYQIAFSEPAGTQWVDEISATSVDLVDGNGTTVATYNLSDNYSQQVAGVPSDFKEIETPGTYTMTIPAGTFHINGEGNQEYSVTWTIKGSDAPIASPYTLTYDKESQLLKLVKDGVQSYDATSAGEATLEGYNGYFSFNPIDPEWTLMGNTCIGAYITLADGTYTLHVKAGTYLFDGVENEAFDITFTVGNGGGSDIGGGDFEGDPFHETIFKAGETVPAIPFVVDNNNVSISTVGRPFLDTTIDVGYNLYDTKELNWKNGTKFVITAKTDINKVIFVPTADAKNAIAYADADKGSYTNGVWEGKLAAGETLTLTANDGINIKEFYICYNGDDFDPTAGGDDEKGVITIQYPVENQLIEKQVDGGKFCVFTTNKEYAQVTIEVKNSNPTYDNLFKFPTRMVDNMGEKSDNLHVGENTIYAATPASGSAGKGDDWYWFKGDSYTMIVKGYVNPWDTEYDAIAEVNFVGNGKEHAEESLVKLLNITPATSFDSFGKIAMVNGVITLEFDGPVTSVKAVTPEGMAGSGINHTATPKAGSDNKVWEINLGDQSSFGSADTDGSAIIEVDVTATASDGIVVLSDDRSDRGLELKYELVSGTDPTPSAVTLGTPVWSVAEGAEIEASTSSINIKFPNATNVEGTYTLEVSGSIGDKNLNLVNVSGTGTMADGADINVSLAENIGYNLFIGTITIKDANGGTVYSTEQGNFQLNFGTKDSSMGGGDNSILGEPTITADADGITVSWPNADLEGTDADYVAFQEWTISVNGENISFYPENIDGISDGISVTIPYEKIAVYDPTVGEWGEMVPVELASGDKITITIPEGAIEVDAGWTTVYANESAITVEATVPSNEPAPTSVVIYEDGVDTHVDKTELNFSKYDVTLTSETTGSTFVVDNFKPGYNSNSNYRLRLFTYNTLKFAAERNIVKIEFVPVVASVKWGAKSVSTGSFADNVWTGNSKTVDLVLNGTNMDVLKIIVTLEDEGTTAGINNAASVNVANDKMYNIAGQQIKVAKGIVIKNGKKMFVK